MSVSEQAVIYIDEGDWLVYRDFVFEVLYSGNLFLFVFPFFYSVDTLYYCY